MTERNCRATVKERSGSYCELCGLTGVQMHHRKNRSQGGRWNGSNILHLCVGCHGWVTEHPAEAYANGWSVPSFRDPVVTPVRLYDGWYLLGNNGDRVQIPERKVA